MELLHLTVEKNYGINQGPVKIWFKFMSHRVNFLLITYISIFSNQIRLVNASGLLISGILRIKLHDLFLEASRQPEQNFRTCKYEAYSYYKV